MNRYIDQEGVERGWYVYLHRAKPNEAVFYVGMGIGKRAWDKNSRNDRWKKRVESLQEGFAVEIYRDNLSELEAEDLERELIAKFGGVYEGTQLTNLNPGERAGIELSAAGFMDTDPELAELIRAAEALSEESEVDQSAPSFISPAREQQLQLVAALEKEAEQLEQSRHAFMDYAEKLGVEVIEEFADGLEGEIYNVQESINDLQSRRISWPQFCQYFQDSFQVVAVDAQCLADELEENPPEQNTDIRFARMVLDFYAGFYDQIVKK